MWRAQQGAGVGKSFGIPPCLISELLADDPTMRDLVTDFLNALSSQADDLREAHARSDWGELCRLAHQIKGAGGSYGYPSISALAAGMEAAFKERSAERFDSWVAELEQLVKAAMAGLRVN